MVPGPSDLVADTKIRVEFDSDLTYRYTIQYDVSLRRRERKETWSVEKRLGEGASGSVWLHRCQGHGNDAELQAVKKIDKAKMATHGVDWYKELEAIAKFSQRKYAGLFVNYMGWYESDSFVYIAMEYIEQGNLDIHLKEPLAETEAQEITRQVADGLCDLHANNFVHRDLKPANVMVVRPGPDWRVKIGDFGISKRIHEDTSLRTSVGTRLFMAPEAQMIYPPDVDDDMTSHYTERVDVWSLGVVVFYMLFHAYPFTIKNAFLPRYVRGVPLPCPGPVTPLAYELLQGTLAPDASKRLSAKEVLESDWLYQNSTVLSGLVHGVASLDVQQPDVEASSASTDMESYLNAERELAVSPENPEMVNPDKPKVYATEINTAVYAPNPQSNGLKRSQSPKEPTVEDREPAATRTEYCLPSKLGTFTRESSPPGVTRASEEPTIRAINPTDEALQLAKIYHSQGVEYLTNLDYGQAGDHLRDALTKYYSIQKEVDCRLRTLDCSHHLGMVYFGVEQYDHASTCFQRAATGRETVLGTTDPDYMASAYWLCCALTNAGEHQKAEVEFSKLVQTYSAVFGPEQENTYRIRMDTASLLVGQGKHTEAEPLIKQILDWYQDKTDPTNPDTLKIMARLGINLIRMEQYTQARSILEGAVKGLRTAIGAADSTTLFHIYNLGLALRHLKKTREAAACFKEAVEGYKANGALKDEAYLDSLFNLGRTYWLTKDYQNAEIYLKEAADSQMTNWGMVEKTIATFYRLGRTQYKLENFRKASDTLGKAVEGQKSVLGPLHPQTLNTLYWLGYSYRRQEKIKQSKPLFQEAFEGQKKVLGLIHWDTLESLVALGNSLYLLKRYKDAQARFQQVVEGWTEYYGPTHEDTLYAMHRLARAYHKAGQHSDAETILRQLIDRQKSATGSSSSATLSAMESLGWTLFRQERYKEGEVIVRDVVKRRKKKLKPDSTKTLDAMRALALHLECQGKTDEAALLFNEVVMARRRIFGRSHKRTVQSEREYRRCYGKMKSSDDDDSDETLTTVSSDSDEFHNGDEDRLVRARGLD